MRMLVAYWLGQLEGLWTGLSYLAYHSYKREAVLHVASGPDRNELPERLVTTEPHVLPSIYNSK